MENLWAFRVWLDAQFLTLEQILNSIERENLLRVPNIFFYKD